jgi:predicted alpha/beta superfamily hydrolase
MIKPKVELKKTQLYTIKSKIDNQQYDVYLSLPKAHMARVEGATYDVLYVLNGQWDFGLMLSVFGNCHYDGLLPEMILIGIGWGGQETNEDAQRLSMRDYSAIVANGQLHGGASAFLGVLEKEIIPFVENTFPTNGNRCLFGSSIAAWFALFAAFSNPKLFNKYILSSPIIGYANGLIFYLEALFLKDATDLDAFIYISYGELETNEPIKDFIKVISSRGYKGLKIIEEEISGVGHAGNKPIGYIKGLLQAYKQRK